MPEPDKKDYWACACVKRDRKTKMMTHIKLNHCTIARCRVCKCARPDGFLEDRQQQRQVTKP